MTTPPPASQDLSTEAFGEGPFRPHGAVHLHVDGDVIVYTAEGPFNLEAIVALGTLRRAGRAQLPNRRRKLTVAVFRHSLLMSPEAFDAYAAGLRSYFAQAPLAEGIAWVVPADIQGRALVLPRFASLFAELGVNWRAFESLEEAKAWLLAQPAPDGAGEPGKTNAQT